MNEKKTMTLLKEGKLQFIELHDTLEEYYKVLNCNLIECLEIKIENQYFILVMDEEGKLKDHYINCVFLDKNKKQIDYIANHFIIQKYNHEIDEIIELDKNDIQLLNHWYKNCMKLIDFENGRYVPTITI